MVDEVENFQLNFTYPHATKINHNKFPFQWLQTCNWQSLHLLNWMSQSLRTTVKYLAKIFLNISNVCMKMHVSREGLKSQLQHQNYKVEGRILFILYIFPQVVHPVTDWSMGFTQCFSFLFFLLDTHNMHTCMNTNKGEGLILFNSLQQQ